MANILAKEMIGLSFPPTMESKVKVLRVLDMIELDSKASIYGALVSIDTNDIFSNNEFPILDVGIKIISKDNGGSDQNAEYALSKLLQMGTVAEYESEFVILANRVTGIFESLLTSFCIFGLKLMLSIELLRTRPTTLGEAFSLARIIDARLEAIAEKEKEQIIKKKADTILSLQSELASPKIKESLDADEDIGIDEVSSAIDCVFHIGESNEVRSKFGKFLENKKSVIEVVMGGGEALGVYREKSRGEAKGGRRVLCYVQGNKRLKKKKMEAAIQRRLWDPEIKSAFQDNTLRARWF
ncbi:hypothetical protein Tco_0814816 [Tanacetum coccineum]